MGDAPLSRTQPGPTTEADTRRATARLPWSTKSPGLARAMALRVTGAPADDRVVLIVTELVTNAISHAASAPRVSIDCDGHRVRIEVSDDAPGRPVLRAVEPWATSGRGVALVAATADGWGVDASTHGKTVWAEVRLRPDHHD